MLKTLYHGSSQIIEKPVFGAGKRFNDYGPGFYCTENVDMAREWAAGPDRNGYINLYKLDTEGLSILDLNAKEFCLLNWLTVLLENRTFDVPSGLAAEAKAYLLENFRVDCQSADLIIGYRADDSYFSFAQDFLNGTISYRQLGEAMRLGKLGEQIVLKSRKAFDRILFAGSEPVDSGIWYAKRMLRDRKARHEYFQTDHSGYERGGLYMTRILDEEIKLHDPRL